MNWIQNAIKKPGALRASLHAKAGEPISASKLSKASNSKNPKLRKRALLAITLKKINSK